MSEHRVKCLGCSGQLERRTRTSTSSTYQCSLCGKQTTFDADRNRISGPGGLEAAEEAVIVSASEPEVEEESGDGHSEDVDGDDEEEVMDIAGDTHD
jgi:hypothetical protein